MRVGILMSPVWARNWRIASTTGLVGRCARSVSAKTCKLVSLDHTLLLRLKLLREPVGCGSIWGLIKTRALRAGVETLDAGLFEPAELLKDERRTMSLCQSGALGRDA